VTTSRILCRQYELHRSLHVYRPGGWICTAPTCRPHPGDIRHTPRTIALARAYATVLAQADVLGRDTRAERLTRHAARALALAIRAELLESARGARNLEKPGSREPALPTSTPTTARGAANSQPAPTARVAASCSREIP
jgi:hypothetical protein